MAAESLEIHQEIAAAANPAEPFLRLPRSRQREVCFELPESVRASLVDTLGFFIFLGLAQVVL